MNNDFYKEAINLIGAEETVQLYDGMFYLSKQGNPFAEGEFNYIDASLYYKECLKRTINNSLNLIQNINNKKSNNLKDLIMDSIAEIGISLDWLCEIYGIQEDELQNRFEKIVKKINNELIENNFNTFKGDI